MVVFGQKWLFSSNSGFIRVKFFFSFKSGCIWAKKLYSGKGVVIGQKCL